MKYKLGCSALISSGLSIGSEPFGVWSLADLSFYSEFSGEPFEVPPLVDPRQGPAIKG